ACVHLCPRPIACLPFLPSPCLFDCLAFVPFLTFLSLPDAFVSRILMYSRRMYVCYFLTWLPSHPTYLPHLSFYPPVCFTPLIFLFLPCVLSFWF
ncbi:hypothetical protein BJ912DRAFT_993516, partial [Pholiota molesta]